MLKGGLVCHLFLFFSCGSVIKSVPLQQKTMQKMEKKTMKPLTRAEMDVMNVLWDAEHALTVNEIVEGYAEPRPAYTTVATFLKILEAKGYVEHRRVDGTGRTFVYSPLLTRERYVTCVLRDVKDTLFGSSVKKMLSFFVQNEDINMEELQEMLDLINSTNNQTL